MAVISLLELKRLATTRSFARGEAYFKDGRVHGLAAHEGTCTAIVRGQDDYSVTLSSTESEINYSCDCPIGLEGEFCKHLVAVGLASLNPAPKSKGKAGNRKRTASKDDLRAYLERQDKDTLVAMLAHTAMENRSLRDRLLLEAAQSNSASLDITAYRRSIARATQTDGFVDYHSAYDFTRRISSSATTRRGRKRLRVAVLRVFGFGLPPRVKKNTDVVPIYQEKIAPTL